MKYFAENKNRDVLGDLRKKMYAYNRRVDNISKKLMETGQSSATPIKYKTSGKGGLIEMVENKHQVNSLIKHMDNIRVSSLGKIKDGKYENVIEGKRGAKIIKDDYEKLKRDVANINKKRQKAKKEFEDRGFTADQFEFHDISFDVDRMRPNTLRDKVVGITEKYFTVDPVKQSLNQRKTNFQKAINTQFGGGSNSKLINGIIKDMSNSDFDSLIRTPGSHISFEYLYNEEFTEQQFENVLNHLRLWYGDEKFNEILNEQGREDLIDVRPTNVTQVMEKDRVETARGNLSKLGEIYG